MKDKKILVVMGGISSEREISLASGEAMYSALINRGFNVTKFILNKDNIVDIIKEKPDLVVLALHGKGGEDGTIQSFLELSGIPYTGSGATSSAVCMNKILTKKLLEYDGIKTAKFITVSHEDFDADELAKEAIEKLGLPIVAKATCEGSSVGVEIAKTADELPEMIKRIYEFDDEILLEEFLPGTETSVPVMKEGNDITVFPIIEIISENEFYDYESKYTEGMCTHIIPARIPDDIKEEIEKISKKVYSILNCRGIARIDFMLGRDGKPYVVEINTLPGMTRMSLVPDSAKAAGVSFDELVERIVKSELAN